MPGVTYRGQVVVVVTVVVFVGKVRGQMTTDTWQTSVGRLHSSYGAIKLSSDFTDLCEYLYKL